MHTSATSQSPSTSQNAFPPFRPCVTVRILLSKHKARLKSSSVLSPLPEDDPAALLLLGFRLQAATRQLSQACPVGTMPPWPPRWWDSALQPRKYSHRGTQTAGLEAKHHLPAAQLVTYSSAHSPRDETMKPGGVSSRNAGQSCSFMFGHNAAQLLQRPELIQPAQSFNLRVLSKTGVQIPLSWGDSSSLCSSDRQDLLWEQTHSQHCAVQLEAGIRISTRVLQPHYRKWTFISLMGNI